MSTTIDVPPVPGSCNACLRIARKHGILVGDRVTLRGGHVGLVTIISHFDGEVCLLLHDEQGQETVLLSLGAAIERSAA